MACFLRQRCSVLWGFFVVFLNNECEVEETSSKELS